MRTFKRFLPYLCDFFRVLAVSIPLALVKTNRGRLVFSFLAALVIGLSGWHFWSGAEIYSIPAPNEVEKMIKDSGLNNPVSLDQTTPNYYGAMIYPSAKAFVEQLEPGVPISASYYFERFAPFGINQGKDKGNLVKVYRAGDSEQMIIYRVICSIQKEYSAVNYNIDSLIIEHTTYKDAAMFIWLLGGLPWFCGTFIVFLALVIDSP